MNKYHNERSMYVSQVQIIVNDLARSIAFYTNVIGLSVIKEEQSKVYLGVDENKPFLVLEESKGAKKAGNNLGLYHFAILVEKRSTFAQILKHLVDLEYPLTGLSDHEISEAIYLQDPDNNGIEIAVDRYDEEGNVYKLEAFGPKHVDYEDLLKELPNEPFTKLPKTTILGHLHLHVNNICEAKRLFVEGMGFAVQFDYYDRAVFVSSQGYHHHLAFNIWNGIDARRKDTHQAGLVSYVINVPHDNIKAMVNQLKNMGYLVKEVNNHWELSDTNQDKIILQAS